MYCRSAVKHEVKPSQQQLNPNPLSSPQQPSPQLKPHPPSCDGLEKARNYCRYSRAITGYSPMEIKTTITCFFLQCRNEQRSAKGYSKTVLQSLSSTRLAPTGNQPQIRTWQKADYTTADFGPILVGSEGVPNRALSRNFVNLG